MSHRAAVIALFTALALGESATAAISGVCPDGSIFIVQSADAIPCREAKRVDPIDLPPLQPHLLPRPYGWERFNRRADPNNPYNLVESGPEAAQATARRRPTRRRGSPRRCPPRPRLSPSLPPPQVAAAAPPASAAPRALPLALNPQDVADLDQIVALSQSVAPATVSRYDAAGERTAQIQLARSGGFEQRVHAALAAQGSAASGPVVLFRAEARRAGPVHGNLTFVQGHVAFHPDLQNPAQFGVIDGALGELAAGQRVLGYAVLPAHLDASAPLDMYWDDRRITATLSH